jgi:protein TonB
VDEPTILFRPEAVPSRTSLIEALANGVTPNWTESVAIVREVATQLHRGGAPFYVPGLENISIQSDGSVMLAGGRPSPEGEVAGVGAVMSQLLEDGSAPSQVLDIQRQALANPPAFATLIDFHNALDFYARPDPQTVLADFYLRASTAAEVDSKNRALQALKEKTKSVLPKDRGKKKNKRPAVVVAAAAVVVASLAAVTAYALLRSPSSTSAVGQTANAALAAITETGKKVQDATNEAVSKLVGGAPTEAAAVPVVNASPAAAAPPAPAPSARQRVAARPLSSPTAAAPSIAPRTPAAGTSVPTIEATRESLVIPVAVDIRVYTAASAEVTPPELVYPQLPKERKEDGTETQPGDLDLLILEDGTVAEARLIPQSDRLQDRMMISAAKAWRFRPAQKDGRPVRYRVRIPITW